MVGLGDLNKTKEHHLILTAICEYFCVLHVLKLKVLKTVM